MNVLLAIHHELDRSQGAAGATLALGDALSAAGCRVKYLSFTDAPYLRGLRGSLLFPHWLAAQLIRQGGRHDIVDVTTGDAWAWAAVGRPGASRELALVTRSHGLEQKIDEDTRAAGANGEISLSWKYPIYHGGFRLWEVRRSMLAADHCILLNNADRLYAIDSLGVRDDRISVIGNGISSDFHAGNLDEFDSKFDNVGPIELVFIGTWIPRKGIATLVRAAVILLERGVPFRLTVLGSAVDRDGVMAAFPEPVRSLVTIHPRFDHRDLKKYLHGKHLVLFLSRVEGFGLSLIEAMGCGIVPIATPVGAAVGAVRRGETGWLVPIDDPLAVATAVQEALANPLILQQCSTAARTEASLYRWPSVALATIDAYERAITRRKRTKR